MVAVSKAAAVSKVAAASKVAAVSRAAVASKVAAASRGAANKVAAARAAPELSSALTALDYICLFFILARHQFEPASFDAELFPEVGSTRTHL